jgi:COP9 signalosome complex subunit 7
MCAAAAQSIPYSELLSQLDLANIRELEDLLITDCFHTGVVKGRLDQQQQRLVVHECIGRDVRLDDLQPVLDAVQTW